jgi:MFS family permease
MLVAVVEASRFMPMAFGAMVGVVSDRIDRRKLMIFVSIVDAVQFFLLGTLIIAGNVQVYLIVAITLIAGLLQVVNQTTRSVLLSDLVEEESLTEAVAISSFTMISMSFFGSAMVAMFINIIGIGSLYHVLALLLVMSAVPLTRIKATNNDRTVTHRSSFKELAEGLSYMRGERNILALLLIAAIANLFLFPQTHMLMMIYAQQVLKLDASGYAWLKTAQSIGQLIGTGGILYVSNKKRKGLLSVAASTMWGVMLLLFSNISWYPLSLLCALAIGSTHTMSMQVIQVLLLTSSARAMRGRVMGVRQQAIMFLFIGDLVWGYIANTSGTQITMEISSLLFIASMAGIAIWAPSLKKLE